MRRWIAPLMAAIVAVALGAAVSTAGAASVSFSTSSATVTAGSITLRDNSLGNFLQNRTLNLSFNATTACNGTNEVQIGQVVGGRGTITSPAGYTWQFTTPWGIWTRCAINGDGSLSVTLRDVVFWSNLGLLGTFTYSGTINARLNTAGTTLNGIGSSFRSGRGSSAFYVTPFAFSTGSGPAIGWTYTP